MNSSFNNIHSLNNGGANQLIRHRNVSSKDLASQRVVDRNRTTSFHCGDDDAGASDKEESHHKYDKSSKKSLDLPKHQSDDEHHVTRRHYRKTSSSSSLFNSSLYENERTSFHLNSNFSSASSDLNQLDHKTENLSLAHESNVILFKNRNHESKTLKILNDFRKSNHLCDIILVVDESEFPCHKAILISNSSYFQAMFSTGYSESHQSKIHLKDIDSDSLRLIIDFMYTGEILITEENVQNLLAVANLFNLINLKESSCQFLQSQMDVSNCLGIREFAYYHTCSILQKHAESFIQEYFSDVIKSEEFLQLSHLKLIELISDDHLVVSDEKIVLDAVLTWAEHKPIERLQHIADLAKHVRFPFIKASELKALSESDFIRKNSDLKRLLDEGLHYQKYHHLPQSSLMDADTSFIRIRPRTPQSFPKILYVIGGIVNKAVDKCDSFDFKSQKWRACQRIPTRSCRAGCIYYNGLIYLLGGFNGEFRERNVKVYNTQTEEWLNGPEMQYRRGTLGVAVFDKKIYAIGGFDGQSGLLTAECLDLLTNQWSMIAPMSVRRSSVASCSLNNYVYAIGGYCGVLRECLNSVERYDPFTDSWQLIAPMNFKRSGACVNIYEGKIYCVGGHDGPKIHKSAEVYNPKTNAWDLLPDMNSCRRNAGFIICNGLFYIIGGDDGRVNLSSAEIYNPQRNIWSQIPQFLSEPRSYLCCLVIEKH